MTDQAEVKEPLNIYQRINAVRKKVGYIKKDKAVSTGGGSYKAVTHDQVTAHLRNALIEQGVLIVTGLGESLVTDIGQTKSGTPMIRYSAKYELAFVNCDQPDDLLRFVVEAHANDTGDKAPGKCLSYAVKAGMLKLFTLETGEDDESRIEPYGGVEKITETQAMDLTALMTEVGANEDKMLAFFKVDEIAQLPAKKYQECVTALEAKRKVQS